MWPDTERVDFSRRAQPAELPEWMDEPCTYEEFRACLVDLEKVNQISLGYRPTLAWLNDLVVGERAEAPLRIVDVGCGGGDMLRRIAVWARRRGVAVNLTGIDLNPHAARAGEEFSPGERIEWRTGDAFSYDPAEGIDVVVNSLLMHHMADAEIVRLTAWMEQVARRGWFVNDLCREAVPYYAFGVLAKVAGWHRFVQHDGPVSFRRSFREGDWERLCSGAGVGPVTMQRWTPGRLCVGRRK